MLDFFVIGILLAAFIAACLWLTVQDVKWWIDYLRNVDPSTHESLEEVLRDIENGFEIR